MLMNCLKTQGFVGEDGKLKIEFPPFNPHLRKGVGLLEVHEDKGIEIEFNKHLLENRKFRKFMVADNLPDQDDNWNEDAALEGKASMSKRHRFPIHRGIDTEKMKVKDMTPGELNVHVDEFNSKARGVEWFNVLTFGLGNHGELNTESLKDARETLLQMKEVPEVFVEKYNEESDEKWRSLGLYFHVAPYNSVQSLHMHMLDMSRLGKSFEFHNHKNLPWDAVMAVIDVEIKEAEEAEQADRNREKKQETPLERSAVSPLPPPPPPQRGAL